MSGRVTISDVADALGIAKGTVSRALNDYPDISDATRQRVRRKAEAMGYHPLAHAQAIRTGRSRAIGLVLQTDIAGAQRPFLSDFLAGVSKEASAASWTLTVATSAGGAEMLATMERLINERKADGFIVPRTFSDDPRANLLRCLHVPFVLYGRLSDIQDSAWFDILGEDAMCDAVLRLAQYGHQKIGFVNGGLEYNFSQIREDGFREGMRQAGLQADPRIMTAGAMTSEAGAKATRELMSSPEPPTAIVFAVDVAALGAYAAAEDFGLAIGKDLSVISYDGIPECEWVRPKLTSFRVDSQMAGRRLAELLIRNVRGEDPSTLRETAKATLWPGGSDGPPTRTSDEIARHIRAGDTFTSCEPTGGQA
ncbi:MAG: LacI family DNA-binding transcriptional regulator [Pseudomonadota bacterium]